MTTETILANARIVTADEIVEGSLRIQNGLIAEIGRGPTSVAGAVDLDGDYLLPGLVELHTDHLERHMMPRPKVRWHEGAAMQAHDAQMAAAGITTVFDAISLGEVWDGSDRHVTVRPMLDALAEAVARGHLRAEHRLHLRCEVSSPTILDMVAVAIDSPLLGIVSVMDHTPGQRQFVREDKYREYYMGKYHVGPAEMDAISAKLRANASRYSDAHRAAIAGECRARGLILASHDDATSDHVAEAKALGVAFAEFPTTEDAALAAHGAGIAVLMGAPNIVRGGSHSGNVAAIDLAKQGTLDILSSDYVPVSLLHAAFLLYQGEMGMPLPQAIAPVTRVPARIAGLSDRGEIAPSLRADLVRVLDTGDMPVVRAVWRQGKRVA